MSAAISAKPAKRRRVSLSLHPPYEADAAGVARAQMYLRATKPPMISSAKPVVTSVR